MEGGNGQGLRTTKRAEIDTTAPFRSVKEAVMLFGERVLAGENNDASGNGLVTVTTELEETKENLQKAREESLVMATCLSTLQQELERTKLELRQLKERESEKQKRRAGRVPEEEVRDIREPSLVSSGHGAQGDDAILERQPSLKKKKKKPLIP
ncbi:hypothetical protein C3L33_09463, partial [Rhododendron williamsianum]